MNLLIVEQRPKPQVLSMQPLVRDFSSPNFSESVRSRNIHSFDYEATKAGAMTDPRDLERYLQAQQSLERTRLGAGVQSPDQLRGYGAVSSPSQNLPIYKTMPKCVPFPTGRFPRRSSAHSLPSTRLDPTTLQRRLMPMTTFITQSKQESCIAVSAFSTRSTPGRNECDLYVLKMRFSWEYQT